MSDLPARSFGAVAEAYHRGRPAYPREAAAWLVGDQPTTVLELGAGTGKLTRDLVALGHDVHATDPDEAMLEVLRRDLPDVRVSVAGAEEIPAPDASYDVVVSAQAFHWFDLDRALPEIARVLKPGGRLALVWNERDERIPWVRRLGRIIGTQDQLRDPTEAVATSGLFGFVEDTAFKHWQVVQRRTILDLVRSRSNVATLDEEAREAMLAQVLALYDDYGRGMDGMQLPYVARCYRSVVAPRVRPSSAAGEPDRDHHRPDEPTPMETTSDGTNTDMLLIDFR
ncbi:class I SAM-dependent methyltransferase [Nocardioides dongkuii]|uniref:class I SAM-dependent methyltransferase n=1 Tax=Nocardioides dongkuii TaxID=2760089 RepID=UPI0015F9BAD4|nr:class I SAM-dependent methyltransferase [Nocardioides dongkuii]